MELHEYHQIMFSLSRIVTGAEELIELLERGTFDPQDEVGIDNLLAWAITVRDDCKEVTVDCQQFQLED